jgi:rhamnosyltransferase subunit B
MARRPKRILFATIGSLGDLHPCLALGLEMARRGESVAIATTEFYRERVEALGFEFHPLRPDWQPDHSELIRQCEDLRSGPEVLFRKLVMPHLRGMYDDLLAATASVDLMIAGELVYAAPLVSEKRNLRWASAILSPCSFFSAHDPSVLVSMPELIRFRRAGWLVNRLILDLARLGTRHWWNPIRALRRELGLRPDCDHLFRDKFSPDLVLALFSQSFASPQPDWPSSTVQPGFVYHDRQSTDAEPSPELAAFLAAGEAPIVFTLGSTAVHSPGAFYEESVEAAKRLGRRAVLLVGGNPAKANASPEVLALPYAPYSQIFPSAAAIVHQGGSGTTAQALRAGRPMLVVPFGWDQPDNGARVQRLGAGLVLPRKSYTADSAARALDQLLSDPSYTAKAENIGHRLRAEDGVGESCDALEKLLA